MSKCQPSLRQWLESTVKRIRAGYPLLSIPEETTALYFKELAFLRDEVGLTRADAAISTALRECRYFPTIAEIRALVPAAPAPAWQSPTAEERGEAEAARASPECLELRRRLKQIAESKTMAPRPRLR